MPGTSACAATWMKVSRTAFKSKFLKVVCTDVSWHFVEHSPEDNIQDVKFNNR